MIFILAQRLAKAGHLTFFLTKNKKEEKMKRLSLLTLMLTVFGISTLLAARNTAILKLKMASNEAVSYTHLRAHETR